MTFNSWSLKERRTHKPGFPTTAPRDYPLHGHQPPQGTLSLEGGYYTALSSQSALEHARALEFALTGAETSGVVAAPSAGHQHNEGGASVMPWHQLGSWRLWMGNNSAFRGTRTVSETSETSIGMFSFVLPAGATRAALRLRIFADFGVTLAFRCRLLFFTPADVDNASPTLHGGYLSRQFDAARTSQGWPDEAAAGFYLTSSSFDFSGFALTNGQRVIVCRLEAAVTSGSVSVGEVQAFLPDVGYRTSPAKTLLASAAAPESTLSAADLQTLWILNARRLRQLIFGLTNPLPRRSRPHDHGEQGGEVLSRHLASYLFGPHRPEGDGVTSGGVEGLPLHEPSAGVDLTSTPKLVVCAPLFIFGQVSEVRLRVLVALPGASTRTLSLTAEIRPREEHGYSPGGLSGVTATLAYSFSGTRYAEVTATLDLSSLGHTGRDRLFELCLWQASNPPAASDYRLLSALVLAESSTTAQEPDALGQPLEEFSTGSIREGEHLTSALFSKTGRILNQLAIEAVGGAPGLTTDLTSPVADVPWRQLLRGEHQHRGSYLDALGRVVHDGAPLRYPLFVQTFCNNVKGGDPEDSTASADAVLGQPLINSPGLKFKGRCSLPRGLRAFDLYLLVQPSNDEREARLSVGVKMAAIFSNAEGQPGVTAVTRLLSGLEVSTPHLSTATASIEVEPDDSDAVWQSNTQRLRKGLGRWTRDALTPTALLPAHTTTTNAARWTEKIRVEFAPTSFQDWAPAYDYQIVINAFVETGSPGSLVADEDSRLLALIAIPSR